MSNKITDEQKIFINNYAYDFKNGSFIKQEQCKWGDMSLCLTTLGEHVCYIEVKGDEYRYNWVRRHRTQTIDNLWIIHFDDCDCVSSYITGSSYITDTEPPKDIFEPHQYHNFKDSVRQTYLNL